MKARILAANPATDLEGQIEALAAEDVTVRHVAYAIDPKGSHFALVLYTPGADRQDDVGTAASRFITDALETGTPTPKET